MTFIEMVLASGLVFSTGFGAGYYVRAKISYKRRQRTLFVGNFE
jgi:hypothetical protein